MRLKIIGGNLVVVVLLGLISFIVVKGEVRDSLGARVDGEIGNDRELFERSFRLSAAEFVQNVSERAAARQMQDVFAGLDESSRRTRAYEAAEASVAWLRDPARGYRGAPDIVVVVDETGKAIARDGARNVMYGKNLLPELPALRRVLRQGAVVHDVWLESQQNKALQTAMAPIRSVSGTVLGALVVGYDLSNGLAEREAELLGREIAFVMGDAVYSSSLEGGAVKDLRSFLFGRAKQQTASVLADQGAVSQLWRATLQQDEFVGVTARLPRSPSLPIGYTVMGNRSQHMQLAGAADFILYMVVLAALFVLVYGFYIGTSLLRPIEKIEEGVLRVINGSTDLRLETDSAELGGLAYRINQLLNVFTGTEEVAEDEQGRVSIAHEGAWKDAAFSDGGARGAAGAAPGGEAIDDPELAAKLAAEPEDAYNDRLHAEYVRAKQALGENVSNIPKERFIQRLRGRAEALTKQNGCRMVRFRVETENDQVILRPVLIR